MNCRNLSTKRRRPMNDTGLPHARSFLRDRSGSIVPFFAAVLLILIAMIGMGIDYTRATLANAKMQAALDATALALSANAATLNSTDLATEANTYFRGMYTGTALTTPTITVAYSNVNNPQIVLSG